MTTLSKPSSPTAAETLYEVFGREDAGQILAHVGSIRAPNDELAQVRAHYLCGRHYAELCLAPTESFIRVGQAGDSVIVKEF